MNAGTPQPTRTVAGLWEKSWSGRAGLATTVLLSSPPKILIWPAAGAVAEAKNCVKVKRYHAKHPGRVLVALSCSGC